MLDVEDIQKGDDKKSELYERHCILNCNDENYPCKCL